MINNSKLPREALEVLTTLKENGHESYLVGGCVRDLCLGKAPKDWDLTTIALPEQVIGLFDHVIPTGLQHGTVTVLVNKTTPIEVTTFRSDGNYSDSRRPDSVQFGHSIEEDISRRDFTINGLLYDGEKVIDYYTGLDDLEQKIIRTIGNAGARYAEDALRMMRCIRLSSQLGFQIENYTFDSIQASSELIKSVSWERIRDELVKTLLSDRASEGINLFSKSGLMQYILPELQLCIGFEQRNYHHHKDVFEHILNVIDATPSSLNVKLAALLHDVAKPKTFSISEDGVGHFYQHHVVGAEMTEEILKRFKFDNNTIENVRILVREHMSRYPKLRQGSIKKLINRLGKNNVDDFINLQLADIIGSKPPFDFDTVIDLKREIKRVLEADEPLSVRDLAINGDDLIDTGIQPGRRMGEILDELLQIVLESPELNTKNYLLDVVRQMP
ncbi:MAG TPA: polynucleotide adenylyltransferase [Desulfosporosinus sp.]|nr:polynucleotide adenylyltransferase [Desulfosporosinus sp.]